MAASLIPSQTRGVQLSVWIFLFVFTLRPMSHVFFAPMFHCAKTPVQAHLVRKKMMEFTGLFTKLALVFLLFGVQDLVYDALDSMYPDERGWVGKLKAFIEAPSDFDPMVLLGPIPNGLLGFLVSYFVTFTAMVDVAVQSLNFLWSEDGYMQNDRRIVEMSFLFSDSLYNVRRRSPDVVSSFENFLETPPRMLWLDKIEKFAVAFHKIDRSGNGSISHDELANMLGRICGDSECRCAKCAAWAEESIEVKGHKQQKQLERIHRLVELAKKENAQEQPGCVTGPGTTSSGFESKTVGGTGIAVPW